MSIDELPDPADGYPYQRNGVNYIVVPRDDGVHFIFDEDGLPLGYLFLRPGDDLDDFDFDDLLPLGAPKFNPVTAYIIENISGITILFLLMLAIAWALMDRRRQLIRAAA